MAPPRLPGEQGLARKRDALANGVALHPGGTADIQGAQPTPEELLKLMAQDKKVKGGKLTLVLARGIGQAYVERGVPMEALSAFLARECKRR